MTSSTPLLTARQESLCSSRRPRSVSTPQKTSSHRQHATPSCTLSPSQLAFNATGPVLLTTAAVALFLERLRRRTDGLRRTATYVEYHSHATTAHAPCVVLEAGANSWSTVWSRVVCRLRPQSRSFTYDRPGFGRTRFTGQRSVSQSAHALLASLREANAHPPYVLVAHSLGALYINEVLRLLPRKDVLGVVYVDAASLETVDQLRTIVPSKVPPQWLARTLSAFGVLRALAPLALAQYAAAFRSNPELWAEARTVWATAEWLQAYSSEWCSALVEVDHHKPLADGWLGSLPISVIVPDIYERTEGKEYIGKMQSSLARYSSDARVFRVEQCGHFVQLERPDVVVEAVRHVVDRARERQCNMRGAASEDHKAGASEI